MFPAGAAVNAYEIKRYLFLGRYLRAVIFGRRYFAVFLISFSNFSTIFFTIWPPIASLTGSEVAIVTVVKRNADFACGFHLKLFKSGLCLRDKSAIAVSCHGFLLLLFAATIFLFRDVNLCVVISDIPVPCKPNLFWLAPGSGSSSTARFRL